MKYWTKKKVNNNSNNMYSLKKRLIGVSYTWQLIYIGQRAMMQWCLLVLNVGPVL